MPTPGFISQISGPATGVVGTGFLTTNGYVHTCAHVVNLALNRKAFSTARPASLDRVQVCFPADAPYTTYEGEVVGWLPPPRSSNGYADIALLSLDPSPSRVRPALFLKLDLNGDERIETIGFPKNYPHGLLVQGRLTGTDFGQWLQAHSSERDVKFMPGHSGAPVFLNRSTAVIAMVSMGDVSTSVSVLIPTPILESAFSTQLAQASIEIDDISETRHITGRVFGLSPFLLQHFRVVIYVRTPGLERLPFLDVPVPYVGWYIHPYSDGGSGKSWAKIESDGSWTIETINRGPLPSERISAFLIWTDYKPPQFMINFDSISYISNRQYYLPETLWHGRL